MNPTLEPGKYIVAVSGGVDSMVLLDVLHQLPGVELVVAHYEHGIREDSDEDRKLVGQVAEKHGLTYIYEHGHLGSDASEAVARAARYAFLRKVKAQTGAKAIMTAHHQDDVIETAIINIVRGTGRKGLSSLKNTEELTRPFLHVPKAVILEYARKHHIVWHEDSTNANDLYLRNYIRQRILPRLGEAGKQAFLSYIDKAIDGNPIIDALLLHDITAHLDENGLDRLWFIMQPHAVCKEIVAAWLRHSGIHDFDAKAIERLVIAIKVDVPGKVRDVNAGYFLKVDKTRVQLLQRSTS
jgi:tRNA(Ile)-lysidine synthase